MAHLSMLAVGLPAPTLTIPIHRGSYIGAHLLFNLINDLRKRDQMQGLPSILAEHFISFFHNQFNKFNNTRARMVDSIYHIT